MNASESVRSLVKFHVNSRGTHTNAWVRSICTSKCRRANAIERNNWFRSEGGISKTHADCTRLAIVVCTSRGTHDVCAINLRRKNCLFLNRMREREYLKIHWICLVINYLFNYINNTVSYKCLCFCLINELNTYFINNSRIYFRYYSRDKLFWNFEDVLVHQTCEWVFRSQVL